MNKLYGFDKAIIQHLKECEKHSEKWDLRFLRLAKEVSTWSKDPSTKVGAVITTKENRIVSLGFNGFARGVVDNEERYNDRDTKIKMVIHAEDNAMCFSTQDLSECIMYTYPFLPCSNCSAKIIQNKISRVVSLENDCDRWNFDLSLKQFKESGVKVRLYEMSVLQ